MFKRLMQWLKTRSKLIEQIRIQQNDLLVLQSKLEVRIDKYIPQLEELDQDKVYFLDFSPLTPKEASLVKEQIMDLFKRLRWTPPRIIFLDKPFQEMTQDQLKKIMEYSKKTKE